MKLLCILGSAFTLFFPVHYGVSITLTPIYVDDPSTGFKDTTTLSDSEKQILSAAGNNAVTLGEARKNAFEHVLGVFEKKLRGRTVVTVSARFKSFSGRTVASASPFIVYSPDKKFYLPCALASATGAIKRKCGQLFGITSDIHVDFGKNTNFYYGLNRNPPRNSVDFVLVTMHELFHGLGFSSRVRGSGSTAWGTIYDAQVYSELHDEFFYELSNAERSEALVSETGLSWDGTRGNPCSYAQRISEIKSAGITADGRPLLYTPTTFSQSSSYLHLSKDTEDIMEPHYPLPDNMLISLGMLRDMGWEIKDGAFPPSCTPTGVTASAPSAGTGGESAFTLELDSEPMSNVSISVTSSSDEVSISPANLVFTPDNWSDSQKVTVTASGGGRNSGPNTYRVELGVTSTDKFYKKLDPDDVFVRLGAGDGSRNQPGGVSLGVGDVSVVEGGAFVFTVTAAPAPAAELSFKYKVTAESGDTATAGTDFTEVSTAAAATVAAGETATAITVSVTDDGMDEADETFTVTLSEPSSGVTISDGVAVGTIEDDDDPPGVSIAAAGSVTEGDSGSTDMVFRVTSGAVSGKEVTVDYGVDGASTAASGTDHTAPASGTLRFAAGTAVLTRNITVGIRGDEVDEADETVVMKLRNPGNATLGTDTARGTIRDDDASPELSGIADRTVRTGGDVDITASAVDADGDSLVYRWRRRVGESTPAMPPGTALNRARLNFSPRAAGKYTMTVTADDGKGNSDTEEVVITVRDADKEVSVPAVVSVTEGAGDATVRITTGEVFGRLMTFRVVYGGGSAVGASDPAGGDYDNDAVTSVTFGAGETGRDIEIPITDDGVAEGDETFTVRIAPAGSLPAGFRLGNAEATVTIRDNDNGGGGSTRGGASTSVTSTSSSNENGGSTGGGTSTSATTPTNPTGGGGSANRRTPDTAPADPANGGGESARDRTSDTAAPADPANEGGGSTAGGCSISGERQVQGSFLSGALHLVLIGFFLLVRKRQFRTERRWWLRFLSC